MNERARLQVLPVETSHCLGGQHLQWTKSRPTATCCWCPYRTQTRERLFWGCPHWKCQRKVLWAEAQSVTGRGKNSFNIWDLAERYSQEPGAKGKDCLQFPSTRPPPSPPSWPPRKRSREQGGGFRLFFLFDFPLLSPRCAPHSWDRAGREGHSEPQGRWESVYTAVAWIRRMRLTSTKPRKRKKRVEREITDLFHMQPNQTMANAPRTPFLPASSMRRRCPPKH